MGMLDFSRRTMLFVKDVSSVRTGWRTWSEKIPLIRPAHPYSEKNEGKSSLKAEPDQRLNMFTDDSAMEGIARAIPL